MRSCGGGNSAGDVPLVDALSVIASWTIPLMLMIIPLYGYIRGINVYETFIDGAKEGLTLAVQIMPYVLSIFVAIGVFRDSGAMDLLISLIKPVLNVIHMPGEVLPLAVVRPLSGNSSLAITVELMRNWGPDTFIGRLASTLQASTDTTFYVLTLYFGSVGITKIRHALSAGLFADFVGMMAALFFVHLFFQ